VDDVREVVVVEAADVVGEHFEEVGERDGEATVGDFATEIDELQPLVGSSNEEVEMDLRER